MINASSTFQSMIYAQGRMVDGYFTISYNGIANTYTKTKIISIDITEEMSLSNDSVTSNSLTLTVDNSTGDFDMFTNVSGSLTLKPVIQVWMGMNVGTGEEIAPMGVFDVNEWTSDPNNNHMTVTFTGYDKFYNLDNIVYTPTGGTINNLQDLANDILTSAKIGTPPFGIKYVRVIIPSGEADTAEIEVNSAKYGNVALSTAGTTIVSSPVIDNVNSFGNVNTLINGTRETGATATVYFPPSLAPVTYTLTLGQAYTDISTITVYSKYTNAKPTIQVSDGFGWYLLPSATYLTSLAWQTAIIGNPRQYFFYGLSSGFAVSSALATLTSSSANPWTSTVSIRDALHQIALGSGCLILQDRFGIVRIIQGANYDVAHSTYGLNPHSTQPASLYDYPSTQINVYSTTANLQLQLHLDYMYKFPKIALSPQVYQVNFTYYATTGVPTTVVFTNPAFTSGGGTNGLSVSMDMPVVNTSTWAQNVANWYFQQCSNVIQYTLDWRQNPLIEVNDNTVMDINSSSTKTGVVVKQEFHYTGYLRGVTECVGS